ncbi:hypothetical protein AB9E07_36230, partial [Rhizobium leguminosarum]
MPSRDRFVLRLLVPPEDGDEEDEQPNRPFLALILFAVLHSVLAGLRWGYGVQAVGVIMPVTAATVP